VFRVLEVMPASFPINVTFLFFSSALTLVAALFAWNRRVPGSFTLSLLLFSMSIWAVGYVLSWLDFPVHIKTFLLNITYIGITAVPTLFMIFTFSFSGYEEWFSARILLLLTVEPLLTLILVWTNGYHHLAFSSMYLMGRDGLSWLELSRGPWYWVNLVYSYGMILAGMLVLVYGMLRSGPLLKNQYRLILLAALAPWAMSMYYEYSLKSSQMDLAPLSFGLSGILFTYSVLRNRFLDIVPVARSRIIESMSDGILVIDRQNRIVDLNPAMEAYLSCKPASLLGKPVSEVMDAWLEDVDSLLNGNETRTELRISRSPSRYMDLRVTPIYDRHQVLTGRLLVFHEVTDRKTVEKRLRYANERLQSQLIEIGTLQSKLRSQAIHDPLTDLFNRRYLDETLDRELARASREGYPLCVIMMDIDHFKQMNDTHGHEAGDLVLKALAKTLSLRNRRGDFACRFGGEEFVVVMPNIAIDTAYRRAEELRTALNRLSVPFENYRLTITISMGIACFPANGEDRESLLRAADRAMYAAKKAGRDYIITYDRLDASSEVLTDRTDSYIG
jgi:diguanylate cyclase (GGDEF)-like protein/PAS domain S-box-containing protein